MQAKQTLNERILNSLKDSSKSVYVLAQDFGTTPNSIRRRLTTLKRNGLVTIADRVPFDGARLENIWAVVGNNRAVA